MGNSLIRWWVVFCTMVGMIATSFLFGGADFILQNDSTYISWLIIAIFTIASFHTGYLAHNNTDKFSVVKYFIMACGMLGMLGTVVGLSMSISGTLDQIDVKNIETTKLALSNIANGSGAAFTTTIVGLVCGLMLETQLIAINGKWRA